MMALERKIINYHQWNLSHSGAVSREEKNVEKVSSSSDICIVSETVQTTHISLTELSKGR